MTAGYRIFLLAAEEMSVSRAAEKTHVTQQCASDHIRRMEEEYGVKLFQRKPRLTLTPAGQAVYSTLQQVKILEEALERNLSEIRTDICGHFSLGLNSTRARVLLPRVLKLYHEMLPEVRISVLLDDTAALQEKLLKGEVDLFVGVNVTQNPLFRVQRLASDEVFLLISQGLLAACFGENFDAARWRERGVGLEAFSSVPFVQNLRDSTITSLIGRHTDALNLSLKVLYSVSDYDIQIELCGLSLAASFCPAMVLDRVRVHNERTNEMKTKEAQIEVFPIEGLTERLRIDFVTHKNVRQPLYIQKFIELLNIHSNLSSPVK